MNAIKNSGTNRWLVTVDNDKNSALMQMCIRALFHISSCADFLSIDEPQITLIVDALELLQVRFVDVNYNVSDKELFDEMYSRNLYEINQSMIFLILKKVYQLSENENFFHKNYSLLMTKPDEPVVGYIEDNMDAYISLVCATCRDKITDDKGNVLAILNHSAVKQSNKGEYINALVTEIEEISSVKDTALWASLLEHHCVPCSKANILSYYFDSGNSFDKILTDFINTSEPEKRLTYSSIVNSHGEDKALAFYKNLITNNALNNEKCTILLSESGMSYHQFAYEGINDDKVIILINLGIIKMNLNNLKFIREKYASCKMHFILTRIDEYAQNTISDEEGAFDLTELKHLLKEKVSDQNLLRLLTFTKEPISIKGINVSDAVKKHIINNNYYENDLFSLISGYENDSPEIKATLLTLCINEIGRIIGNNIKLPYSLLIALLQSSSASSKEELLAAQLTNLVREQAIECFKILKMSDLLSVFDGKWPSIAISNVNTLILETMESKRWISSFAGGEDGYYRVRARRNAGQDE